MEPQPASSSTKKKYWGCLGVLVVLLAIVLVIIIAGISTWQTRNSKRVEEALAKIRSNGEPTTAEELSEFYSLTPGATDQTDDWLEVVQLLQQMGKDPETMEMPYLGEGAEVPTTSQPWELEQQAQAYLQRYETLVDKLHTLGEVEGETRYPLNFADGFGARLDHAQTLREAGRLMRLQAEVAARQDDAETATKSLLASLASAESLKREPILISQLIRMALIGLAADQFESLVPSVAFTDEQLERLDTALAKIEMGDTVRRALIGERAFGSIAMSDPAVRESFGPGGGFMLNTDAALLGYLDYMTRLIEASKLPIHETLIESEKIEAELETEAESSFLARLRLMGAAMLLPAVSAVNTASARTEAQLLGSRVIIALERFHRANGKYPETLEDLVPDYLDSLPIDPYINQPLRYIRRSDHDVTVYSVGNNRLDDGGVKDEQKTDVTFRVVKPEDDEPE